MTKYQEFGNKLAEMSGETVITRWPLRAWSWRALFFWTIAARLPGHQKAAMHNVLTERKDYLNKIWESGHCGAPPSHVSVSSPPFPPTHPGPVLDQGKRPLRCAPSSTPRPWTPTYILLLSQSTALIGESGHRGAPPFHVYCLCLLQSILLPIAVGLDLGKRPLRRAPFSRLCPPHISSLPITVRYLIRESGHCGAPPLQLLARGLLPTFSFSPVEWSGNAAIAVRPPFKFMHYTATPLPWFGTAATAVRPLPWIHPIPS